MLGSRVFRWVHRCKLSRFACLTTTRGSQRYFLNIARIAREGAMTTPNPGLSNQIRGKKLWFKMMDSFFEVIPLLMICALACTGTRNSTLIQTLKSAQLVNSSSLSQAKMAGTGRHKRRWMKKLMQFVVLDMRKQQQTQKVGLQKQYIQVT